MMNRPLVLVIDDDLDVRDAYADALDQAGYQTVCLTDGRMALDFLRSQRAPDVILLDMVMPSMDGFEFRQAQLRDSVWRTIPTVVITADRLVRDRWMETDLDAILTKPIKIEHLLAAVKRALDRKQQASPRTTGVAPSASL